MAAGLSGQGFDLRGRRVFVAGYRGMVGSAIVRRLATEDCEILTVGRPEVDFRDQRAVRQWMRDRRPEAVFLAAATVGGILANDSRPAEFLYDNMMIEANIIDSAREIGVTKLLFLGSSCIYPKFAPQPMSEDVLLTGALEPTNEWYAIAKIAGIKLCQAYRRQYDCDFISAMPTNLYGPYDNYDLQASHVVPALMRKAHQAKIDGQPELRIWGTGTPRREFLHVDDLADACVFLMQGYSAEGHVNVGTGTDVTINELAASIAAAVGYDGRFVNETDKPDGAPRKLLDVGRLTALGWQAKISLDQGLRDTYAWFLENKAGGLGRTS
ncbi:MAG TPA: GDP-L-fucose synthase [Stellaceae bacterium]|nr:GDP-L-fucose synthase [Stellaceae bacterium]